MPALYDAIRKAEAVTDKPSFIVLRTIIAWPAPDAQNTGKAHGSALGADEVAATKKVLGFDPRADLRGRRPASSSTPAGGRARQGRAGRVGRRRSTAGRRSPPPTRPLRPAADAHPARGLGRRRSPSFPADEKGVATRKASGAVINASPRCCPSCGAARPTSPESNNTTIEGAPSFLPERPRHQDVEGRPARRPRAPLRHPRARHGRDHERHRRPRRHPRLRRHVPHVLRLHARRRCGWPR